MQTCNLVLRTKWKIQYSAIFSHRVMDSLLWAQCLCSLYRVTFVRDSCRLEVMAHFGSLPRL